MTWGQLRFQLKTAAGVPDDVLATVRARYRDGLARASSGAPTDSQGRP